MANAWDVKKEDFPTGGSLDDKIKFLLNYAVLAPSTHNSQPWRFRVEAGFCKIYFDKELKLPKADPIGRDLYISIGCMLENLIIAAEYFGIFGDLRIEPKEDYVGEIFFRSQGDSNSSLEYLLDTIPKRVNARGIFESRALPEGIISELHSLNSGETRIDPVTDPDKIKRLSMLTVQGLRLAHGRKDFRKEMSGWIVNSLSRRKDGLPGYSLGMPLILSMVMPTMVKFFNLSWLLSRLNYKSMISAPLICVLSSGDNNIRSWLEVGRTAQRLMLHLQSRGIRTSIFVAAVEMGDLYKNVQSVLGINTIPQFLFCAGYMPGSQRHSPRHEVSEKIITKT